MTINIPTSIGWKTIAGAALYALGQALPALSPDLAPYAPMLLAAGAILGGIGVAHKGARMLAATKDSTESFNAVASALNSLSNGQTAAVVAVRGLHDSQASTHDVMRALLDALPPALAESLPSLLGATEPAPAETANPAPVTAASPAPAVATAMTAPPAAAGIADQPQAPAASPNRTTAPDLVAALVEAIQAAAQQIAHPPVVVDMPGQITLERMGQLPNGPTCQPGAAGAHPAGSSAGAPNTGQGASGSGSPAEGAASPAEGGR